MEVMMSSNVGKVCTQLLPFIVHLPQLTPFVTYINQLLPFIVYLPLITPFVIYITQLLPFIVRLPQ